MRLILSRICTATVFFVLISATAYSQADCNPTGLNNTSVSIPCNQVCGNMTFQVPDLRSSSSYELITTPYRPYTYVTTGATEDTRLYNDDCYSNVFDLPFPFCFYDQVYTKAIIGSNGVVTFDILNNQCPIKKAAWNITNPIPFSSGIPCVSTNYYPKASIMAAFMDLDPRPEANLPVSANSSPADRKIEWRIEGAAPCRRFVVSFYHIGTFENTSCGLTNPATFQIVMYESTGIIDVYFENKVCVATSGNGSRAILGIQDENASRFTAAPGKNATFWTASREGYRFVPSGASSRFLKAELLKMDLTTVAIATTANSTAGLLDLNFANVCNNLPSQQYILKTTFASCSDGVTQLVSMDTITVNRPTNLQVTAATTPATCGPPNGTVTLTIPANAGTPPYTFVVDANTPLTGSSPFTINNLTAGPHTLVVTDASTGCTNTLTFTIEQNNNIDETLVPTDAACPGINNGKITATAINGTGPFTFVLNPGATTQTGATSTVFSGLAAGTYTISISDASGCTIVVPRSTTVNTGNGITGTASPTATSCSGATNGKILVTPSTGTGPFTFTLDGTIVQTGAANTTFIGLVAGTHSIHIVDAGGCTTLSDITVTVASGPGLTTSATHTDVTCFNSSTGSISVLTPVTGVPPFQYSLDNVTWQTSNVFNGLSAGSYTVYYRESGVCGGQLTQVIAQPSALNATLTGTAATCNAQPTGIITVNASGGAGPYQYSINGGSTYQSGNTFTVPAGTYTVLTRDANGCINAQSVTITQPNAMTASAVTTNATCNGGNNGTINITGIGGNGYYQYSIDGTTFQPSNVFNVAPGNYIAVVKDNIGCTATVNNIVVGLTNDLTFTTPVPLTICEGTSTQLQVVSNATQYSWSPATGLSNTAVSNPVARPTTTTNYLVAVTYGRCSTTIPYTVKVNAAPIADAGSGGIICAGQSFQLSGAGGIEYLWSPATSLSDPTLSDPSASPVKTTTYTLVVKDGNGCASIIPKTVTVEVTPPIQVNTYPTDTVVYEGDKLTLLATSVATNYVWSPGTGLSDPFVANPLFTAGAAGQVILFKVTASTPAGCTGEALVQVKVYKGPELYTPTAFTPNGDLKNDYFFPFPVGIKEITYFRVYNRWGKMMFSTKRLNDGWDGRFAGRMQDAGVYVWMAEGKTLDGRVITRKGTVTLIR